MDLKLDKDEERFRDEARTWLEENLRGEHGHLRGRGGPGDEDYAIEERLAWNRKMGAAGWLCLGWPTEHGGRGCTLREEVIFNEQYVLAEAPGRIGHIGETLLGPTILAFGTDAQKTRFLPPIVRGEELWCQGYSEPNAGSDLASLSTRAELVGDEWVIHGQKIWTSLAEFADFAFVLCRTDPAAPKHRGISYLLVPMRQAGIEKRPIVQMTGGAEFCEVFFDGAKTAKENVVGAVNDGWRVAMGTLAFERGASTLGQQQFFELEMRDVLDAARRNGAAEDPVIRQRLADAWIGLRIMRISALRSLPEGGETADPAGGGLDRTSLLGKLYWSNWHRDFGKLAMDVLGPHAELAESGPYELTKMQKSYLFSRADTIYAGTNEIQRNIIGERALGLPKEPK
jgi:alkylation response protein AidB-like acyl-CoA dehydrogenase